MRRPGGLDAYFQTESFFVIFWHSRLTAVCLPSGMMTRYGTTKAGFALIATIWTLAILSMLVASLTLDAYMEGKVASYVRTRHQATALIDSGVTIAELLMARQEKVTGEETEEEVAKDRWIIPAIRLKRGQRTEVVQRVLMDEEGHLQFDTTSVEAEPPILDEIGPNAPTGPVVGEIRIIIEPEPARWNINKLNHVTYGDNADLIWNRILTVAGVPEEDQGELVDSFYDWVDEDSVTVSSEGAESDYYENLDPPYTCKNAPLDTVDELLYIKGFDRNGGVILNGGVWNPEEPESRQIHVMGIAPLFTCYGEGKINVNAAPREVLMTVPALEDADGLIVDTILEEREGLNADEFGASHTVRSASDGSASLGAAAVEDYHFKDLADLTARVPGLTQDDVGLYLTVDGDVYRLEIEGRVGRITRRIEAVVQYSAGRDSGKQQSAGSGSSSALTVLRWQEKS